MAAIAECLQMLAATATTSSSTPSPLCFMGFQELPLILAEKYLKPHLTRMGYINFLGNLCWMARPTTASAWPFLSCRSYWNTSLCRSKIRSRVVDSSYTSERPLSHLRRRTWKVGVVRRSKRESSNERAKLSRRSCSVSDRLRRHGSGTIKLQVAIIACDLNWDDERKRGGKA